MVLNLMLKGVIIGFSIAAPVGPIGVLCVRRSLADGRRIGLAAGLGAATADAVYGGIAGFGLTAVSSYLVGQKFWLGLVGGLYLCYLGLRTFTSRPADRPAELRGGGMLSAFGSTLFLTLTNPMTILSFVGVFAGFGLGASPGFAGAGALVGGVFIGSALWWLLLSSGVALFRSRVTSGWMQAVNRLSGVVIFAFGLYSLLTSTTQPMNAEPMLLQSQATQTALLELYTSEGCSSCPPAEAWLSHLKSSPHLWKDFVPAAFHVDYWDHLGWKDPFAAKAYSERQGAYAADWHKDAVYTPGFVLDGKEWRGWGSRNELPHPSSTLVGVLTARSADGKQWTLRFQPAQRNATSSFGFHAVLLGFDLNSDINAGENRGRKLKHDFLVLALGTATSGAGGDSIQALVTLSLPARISAKRLAVAAWVTPSASLQPLQTVGGWLHSTQP